MKLKMSVKKYFAVIMALILFTMSTQVNLLTARAAGEEGETGGGETTTQPDAKPTIYIDYLGLADSDNSRGPQASAQQMPDFKTIFDKNNTDSPIIFWVGVRISNYAEVPLFKSGGIHDMEIAFDYDPEYIVPVDDLTASTGMDNISETKWRGIIEQFNLANYNDDGINKQLVWDSNTYEITTGSYYAADPDNSPGREETPAARWKTQFISIAKRAAHANIGTNRFASPTADDGDAYILRIPFRLISKPEGNSTPYVLKMALGPSTFVMTGGNNGEVAYSWEKEDRTQPVLNLKNTFVFDKNINIFKPEGSQDSLMDLEIYYTENGEKNILDLYTNVEQNAPAGIYSQSQMVYYITVPEGVTSIGFDMEGLSKAPSAQHSDYAKFSSIEGITRQVGDKWSGTMELTGTVGAPGTAAGIVDVPNDAKYKDVLIITIGGVANPENGTVTGGTTYTVHIRRDSGNEPTGEAKIVLGYGNSPYGEIMRDDTKWREIEEYASMGDEGRAAWQKKAKEEFDSRNQFVTNGDYTPVRYTAGTKYNVRAWGDVSTMTEVAPGTDLEKWKQENPEGTAFINHDKDSNAIFVFIKQANVLPEIMLYDSEGKEVQPTEALPVTVSVTLDYMRSDAVNGFKGESDSEKVTMTLVGATGENILDFTDRSKLVKPGIYTMTYSYTDKNGQRAEEKRTLIILAKLGDVDMNTYFDTTDAQLILRHSAVNVPNENLEGNEFGGRLYAYRICDVDGNSYFDTTDAQLIKRYSAAPIVQLYNALEEGN